MSSGRDYGVLCARVEGLRVAGRDVDTLATVGGYPLYVVRSAPSEGGRYCVVISGGMHGDEPAGVEAVLRLVERDGVALAPLDWVAFPCVNPTGHVADTRENGAGLDINRSFEDDATQEALAVKGALSDRPCDLFMECHEDWEATAFYAFEVGDPDGAFGPTVMQAVARVCPVSRAAEVDGMRAVDGVIQTDESFDQYGHRSLALYMRRFHADRGLTFETPTSLPFEQRVAAHTSALHAALGRLVSPP